MKSGIIPDYFEGFLNHFEGTLQSFFNITNQSARHGKKDVPNQTNKIDKPFAAFVVHLTATLLVFVIERYAEAKAAAVTKTEGQGDFPEADAF
jgi:hypothetical protein